MKVMNLATSATGDQVRAHATVTWEDCDRPERIIYFGTDPSVADDLSPNPNAFLLATILFALRHGERRVLVEGQICPQLRNGLVTAMQQLKQWYGPPYDRFVAVEATKGFAPALPNSDGRTASFMSGGVDALTRLRRNRLDFPLEHPASIRDCFFTLWL